MKLRGVNLRRYLSDVDLSGVDPTRADLTDGIFEDEHTACPMCGAPHDRMETYDTGSGWGIILLSILSIAAWIAVFYLAF